jgi:hypothetical protein
MENGKSMEKKFRGRTPNGHLKAFTKSVTKINYAYHINFSEY